jgi:hypothetical protein
MRADAVAVRIGIGEDAALQHLVGRIADARHDVRGREGGLLDLGEIMLGLRLSSSTPISISG